MLRIASVHALASKELECHLLNKSGVEKEKVTADECMIDLSIWIRRVQFSLMRVGKWPNNFLGGVRFHFWVNQADKIGQQWNHGG
jgi:hypothetical protein